MQERMNLTERTVRGGQALKARGSDDRKGRTGWKQAIGFLGSLDKKTLKHARTTRAEFEAWQRDFKPLTEAKSS